MTTTSRSRTSGTSFATFEGSSAPISACFGSTSADSVVQWRSTPPRQTNASLPPHPLIQIAPARSPALSSGPWSVDHSPPLPFGRSVLPRAFHELPAPGLQPLPPSLRPPAHGPQRTARGPWPVILFLLVHFPSPLPAGHRAPMISHIAHEADASATRAPNWVQYAVVIGCCCCCVEVTSTTKH